VDLLFKFYLKCLRKESLSGFPWGSFTEAHRMSDGELDEDIIDIIEKALNEKKEYDNAAKSPSLVNTLTVLSTYLSNKKKEFDNTRLETKNKLILQLNHNRLYQLKEQEEQTLQQLIKIFPQDNEVKLLHQAHLEKKADEILARVRTPIARRYPKKINESVSKETSDFISQLKLHINTLADRLTTESPDQIYNLTMLALQFGLYDLSLELINKAPVSFAGEWLKAEILFESARFLDLLKHIESLERSMTSTPEATYGAIYLKAQAYYGLGQKEIAIQLLESLSAKVPSYRSTETLIHEWKNS
jgi:tetratricopeptide (TPR) repeat protein